jgi:hypothetical protein
MRLVCLARGWRSGRATRYTVVVQAEHSRPVDISRARAARPIFVSQRNLSSPTTERYTACSQSGSEQHVSHASSVWN